MRTLYRETRTKEDNLSDEERRSVYSLAKMRGGENVVVTFLILFGFLGLAFFIVIGTSIVIQIFPPYVMSLGEVSVSVTIGGAGILLLFSVMAGYSSFCLFLLMRTCLRAMRIRKIRYRR